MERGLVAISFAVNMVKQVQSNWEPPFPVARLRAEQVAVLLNCHPDYISVLNGEGLLHPLGSPSQSSVKYFATVEIERLCADPVWLGKVTDAIYDDGRRKNNTL